MTRTAAEPSLNKLPRVLSIPVDIVHFIIDKLHEPENEYPDAAGLQGLHSFIDRLPKSQQVDLVGLTWLGRDNCLAMDWPAIRGETSEAYYAQTARYLLGMSMVGNFLEQGLSILEFSGEHATADQPPCQTGNAPGNTPLSALRDPNPGVHVWTFGGCFRRERDRHASPG